MEGLPASSRRVTAIVAIAIALILVMLTGGSAPWIRGVSERPISLRFWQLEWVPGWSALARWEARRDADRAHEAGIDLLYGYGSEGTGLLVAGCEVVDYQRGLYEVSDTPGWLDVRLAGTGEVRCNDGQSRRRRTGSPVSPRVSTRLLDLEGPGRSVSGTGQRTLLAITHIAGAGTGIEVDFTVFRIAREVAVPTGERDGGEHLAGSWTRSRRLGERRIGRRTTEYDGRLIGDHEVLDTTELVEVNDESFRVVMNDLHRITEASSKAC